MTLSIVKNKPKFQMKLHMNTSKGGFLIYRDDILKCEMHIFTPKEKDGYGKPQKTFYIDGSEKEYLNPFEFIKDLGDRNGN